MDRNEISGQAVLGVGRREGTDFLFGPQHLLSSLALRRLEVS